MALKLKGSTSGFVGLDAPAVAGNNTLILPDSAGSAHQILANDITAGVTTFTSVTISRNGDLTVPGTISIGGTLTYEDVTSVDSVGIVTARSGVRINGGGLTIIGDTTGLKATGISTFVDVSARNITVSAASTFTGNIKQTSPGTSTAKITLSNATDTTGMDVGYSSGSGLGFINVGQSGSGLSIKTGGTAAGNERLNITSAGKIEVKGTRAGALQASDDDTLQLYTASTDESINRGSGITFYNHDGSGSEMGGTIQVAKENATADNVASYMRFSTRPAGGSATEALRIHSDGQITIGNDHSGAGTLSGKLVVATTTGGVIIAGDTGSGEYLHLEGGSGLGRIGTVSNHDLVFVTNGTSNERLRIDTSGRMGLGITPTDYHSNNTAVFQLKDGNAIFSRTGGTFMGMFQNIKYNSSDVSQYVTSNPGSAYFQASGEHKWYTASSGTADNNATLNERLRIDNNGLLRAGSTSNTDTAIRLALHNSGGTGSQIQFTGSGSGETSGDGCRVGYNGSGAQLWNFEDNYTRFATNNTERYRIHNNGRQSWNNTTFPYGETFHFYNGLSGRGSMSIYHGTDADEPGLIIRHGRAGANSGAYTGKYIQFRSSDGNERGSVTGNNSATAYNTSSDYRLKENEVTISDAISKVKQLKPYTFNFKVIPDQKVDGFFAHEAQEVIPYAVFGEKDAEDMQQMDYGKLTPLLTAALKEAVARIETLESEVAALKGS